MEIGTPAHLHLRLNQLLIEKEGAEAASIPIEDLGVLIIDEPSVTCSHRVLAACCKENVAVIFSDERHLPGGILLSLNGNTLQSRVIADQVNAGEPLKKRLWQQIVREKIRGQARTLKAVTGDAGPLLGMVELVGSGDPDNVEGRAARLYWPLLFGDSFRRDHTLPGRNALLNYGYAIMRAAVARAIVGSGLHPSLGLHHHNQYDAFCLADDLMEPLRPIVDLKVARLTVECGDNIELGKEVKAKMLGLLNLLCNIGRQRLPLMVAMHSYTASLAQAFGEGEHRLDIPIWDAKTVE